jgi:transposase
MHLAQTRKRAREKTVDAFGWYFEKVMALVPHGAKVPRKYEACAAMASAHEVMPKLSTRRPSRRRSSRRRLRPSRSS